MTKARVRSCLLALLLVFPIAGCVSERISVKTSFRVCPQDPPSLKCPRVIDGRIRTPRDLENNRLEYKDALIECRAALDAWREAWTLCSEKWLDNK